MKVYPNLTVELTYQNFGSTWLCILRGNAEEITYTFNGLFNLQATNGDYQFEDSDQNLAVFWSSEKGMHRFFSNYYLQPREENAVTPQEKQNLLHEAAKFADAKMLELRNGNHEKYLDFKPDDEIYYHSVGKVKAERPDDDFRDAVLNHAFTDRDLDYRKYVGTELDDARHEQYNS